MSLPAQSSSASPALPARAWLMWVLAVLGLLLQDTLQTTYAEVNPSVQLALRLDLGQIALAAAINNWTFAVAQFFSGTVLDRFDARRALTPPLVLVAAGAWFYASADSFAQLAGSQALLALGASLSFVDAGYVRGRWFGHAHYGLMFGAVQLAAGVASAGAQLLASSLLGDFGWRSVIHGYVIAAVVLAALFVFLFRDAPGPQGRTREDPLGPALLECLRAPRTLWLPAGWGAIDFGLQLALGLVWPPRIMALRAGSSLDVDWAGPASWLGVGVGSVALNLISNRLCARKPVLVASYLVMIAAVALILLVAGLPAPVYALLFFVFGAANGVHMLAFTTLGDTLSQRVIGTASAVVNGAFFVLGGVFAALPARMLVWWPDWEGTARPYWPFLAILVLGLALVLAQRETWRARPTRAQ